MLDLFKKYGASAALFTIVGSLLFACGDAQYDAMNVGSDPGTDIVEEEKEAPVEESRD